MQIQFTPFQRAQAYARRARAIDTGPLVPPKRGFLAPKPVTRGSAMTSTSRAPDTGYVPRLVAPAPAWNFYASPSAPPPAPAVVPAPAVAPGLGVVEAPPVRKRARTLLTG